MQMLINARRCDKPIKKLQTRLNHLLPMIPECMDGQLFATAGLDKRFSEQSCPPDILLWLGPGVRVLRHIEKPSTVALFLQRQAVRGLVQTELPWTQLLTSRLHLQADCGAMLLASFPGLHGDSLPEVSHSICSQGINGCQDGRVCVLVGVWQPGLLSHAEAR